jgi:subtilisin-like proprotein convertase family protein
VKTLKLYGAAALAVAMAGTAALASLPPRQAGAIAEDHEAAKARQLAREEAAGLVPGVNSEFGLRGVCAFSAGRESNLPIPAFVSPNPGVVTDQLTTAGDPLLNVRVRLNILHTWQGDVIAVLRHDASGTEVKLIDRPGVPESSTVGFSADNYGDNTNGIPFVLDNSSASRYDVPTVVTPGTTNVTGNWLADDQISTLAAFDGLTANTTWTLTVSDNAAGDNGTLVRWSICSDNLIGAGVPTGVGAASPSSPVSGDPVLFTVQVSPAAGPVSTGLAVQADLSQVGGSATQMFFDNGTNGDAVPNDNIFSFLTVVTGATGVYSLPFTVSDAEARSSNGAIALSIAITNDACENAISVPVGSSIVSTNVGATNDPGQPTCNGLSTFNAGVWFTTVGNGNVLNLTTCSANTVLNTRLYVYTGSCGAFTCVGAATGTTPACSPSTAASVQICSTLGETYHILITNDTSGTGQFELSVQDLGACPTNDLCENAVPVSVGGSVLSNNVGATNDPGQPTCNGLSTFNAGVWFTTVGTGNNLIASTCSANTVLNTRLYVYSGTCGAFTCVGANATAVPACSPSNAASVRFCSTLGETYYILVTNDTSGTGQFELSVTDDGPFGCQPTGGCCTAGVCSLNTEALCLAGGGSYLGDGTNCDGNGPVTAYTSTPFLSIPDNQCVASGFVTDTIVVPDNVAIADINVRVQVTHTFIGDLRIRLTNGVTTVSLWERICGTNANMDVTFDDEGAVLVCGTEPTVGTFVPSGTGAGSLSSFDGQMSAGNWTLEICDGAGADLGTLDFWELTIREQDPNTCPGGPAFCDADWCQDGSKSVADIFCFLADWFALDPEARTYGGAGTPVQAIFAWLAVWFATPNGPCTP